MSIASEWNIQQKELKELIGKKETFDKAKDLYLSMHRNLHFSDNDNTLMDQLWKMLDIKDFSIMPTVKDVTIAWNIWHITITFNSLWLLSWRFENTSVSVGSSRDCCVKA